MKLKVCHLTSVHQRNDIRVFVKECKTLTSAGYAVSLIVADGKKDETSDGIEIFDVGKKNGRIARMTKSVWAVYKKAIKVNADIYHFHDPELVWVAYLLLRKRKKVIYDVHEDLPRQILGKYYISKSFAFLISFAVELVENFFSKKFSQIIVVTPFIKERFLKLNKNTEMVRNFPLLSEFEQENKIDEKSDEICYVGSITSERGIENIVSAMDSINARLNLAGNYGSEKLRDQLKNIKGWEKVNDLGLLTRKEVKQVLARSKMGLVLFLPFPNHINAYPNKIFEYMAAGIPVIASDFKLWNEIIVGDKCGICVNPDNTQEIALAVNSLLKNEADRAEFAENGKKAVREKYNWEAESNTLLKIYKSLE